MSNYSIKKETLQLVADLLPGIDTLMTKAAKEYVQLRPDTKINVIENLAQSIFASWTLDATSDSEKQDAKLFQMAKFMSKSCILAYLGMFDNDKNLDKLKSDKEDELVKELLSNKKTEQSDSDETSTLTDEEKLEAKTKANMAFEFGYSDLMDLLQCAIESVECNENAKSLVEGKVESNLLSNIRQIDFKEYLKNGYLDKDVKLIALMGNKPKIELVKEILEMIKASDTYNAYISEMLMNVLSIYKYFFQDSFGLRPYAGVLSYVKPYSLRIDDKNYLGQIEGAQANFDNIANFLKKQLNVEEQKDRQFNIDKIIASKSDVPLYFPNKIVEYAMGRELTYNLTEKVYRKNSCSDSWENYCDAYVKNQIEDCIIETIYKTVEMNFDRTALSWIHVTEKEKDEPFLFASDSFQLSYNSKDKEQKASLEEYITGAKFTNAVNITLDKLLKALCTGIAIVKYNNVGGKANSICLRIVDTTNSLNENMTKNLYGSMVLNKSVAFEPGDIISKGKTNERGDALPFKIYEFRHDFDAQLATAEPLFGYTAVQLYLNQKKPMGWSRILLGEDIKGTPLFASKTNKDDIPMQENIIHNMMAGSRSGKGVMTMNILASAIADERPIFYIDRKPDMAVMFYNLTKGNMFVINGGQYLAKNDPTGAFGDEGEAVKGWKQAYESLPNYLTNINNGGIFPNKTYEGFFGDFVYYRAMLLIYAILTTRAASIAKPAIYNNLGGAKGIVAVFDEFKNWQELFEAATFEVNGLFAKSSNRLTDKDLMDYKKLISDIKAKETQLNLIKDDPKKAAQVTKTELDLQNIKENIQDTYTPLKVYCTTVMNKFADSVQCMAEQFAAGFKDKEGTISDVFVIGQHIKIDGYYNSSKGTYTQTGSGAFNNNKETQNKSLMRGLLNNFPGVDWFMGYNKEVNNEYMGATESNGGSAYKWITKKQYWGYVPDQAATMETLRTETPSKVTYFKPYLVLNNNKEDDPNNRKTKEVPKEDGTGMEEALDTDYEFVGQCRDRVNSAVPGLWEKVRLKHLTNYPHDSEQYQQIVEEASKTDKDANKHYGELNDGIGFEGLAKLTKRAAYVGKVAQGEAPDFSEELNLETDLGESKRIANFVASKLGYSSYQEYLYDFSPKGLFSVRDMMNCILGTESPENLHTRLPLFFTYNVFNSEEQEQDNKVADNKQYKYDSASDISVLEEVLSENEKVEKMQEDILNNYNRAVDDSVKESMTMGIDKETAEIVARNTVEEPQLQQEDTSYEDTQSQSETIESGKPKKVYYTVGDMIGSNLTLLVNLIKEVAKDKGQDCSFDTCVDYVEIFKKDDTFIDIMLAYLQELNPDVEVILQSR